MFQKLLSYSLLCVMWIIYGNGNIDSAYGYHMGPMWESLIPTGMTSVWMPISRNF